MWRSPVGGTLARPGDRFSDRPLRAASCDALGGDTGAVRADLEGLGVAGPFMVFASPWSTRDLWYPAEILDAAAGSVRLRLGLALVMAAWMASGCSPTGSANRRAPAAVRAGREERSSASSA